MIEPLTGSLSFEPGDVVALKSGGPAMTVIGVKEEGVQCVWYAEAADEVKTGVVPAIALEKAIAFDEVDDDGDEDDDDDKHKKQGKKKRHGDD
ncbi:MAG TPA: DUF2158 domain-containing protein [Methylocella sp.]|nr:DUF2158 domain-containing protein [Methylocella sp.]